MQESPILLCQHKFECTPDRLLIHSQASLDLIHAGVQKMVLTIKTSPVVAKTFAAIERLPVAKSPV